MPEQERGDADAGLAHQRSDEPKPRTPRSGRGQLVDLDELDLRKRDDHELGNPHPGLDHERSSRASVLSSVERAARRGSRSPRDPGVFTIVIPCALDEARARLHEAGVPVGDRDGEPGRDEGALARRQLDALAGREVQACVARVRARRQHGVRPQPADGQLDEAQAVSRERAASATR